MSLRTLSDLDPPLLCPSRFGQPLNWHNVSQRAFKAILADAGLPRTLRAYDLRHSMATLLLSQDEPAKVVAERLGHSTTALTLDTYSHVIEEMQEQATGKLGAVLYRDG